MATKKCTFTSKSKNSKAATLNIDVLDLPNIGDTLQFDSGPLEKVVNKNFRINDGEVTQIEFSLE